MSSLETARDGADTECAHSKVVKGGMLKDDADLAKLGFKEVRHSLWVCDCRLKYEAGPAIDGLPIPSSSRVRLMLLSQVIGAAGELPKAPSSPVVWLEDMTDKQLAEAVRFLVFCGICLLSHRHSCKHRAVCRTSASKSTADLKRFPLLTTPKHLLHELDCKSSALSDSSVTLNIRTGPSPSSDPGAASRAEQASFFCLSGKNLFNIK